MKISERSEFVKEAEFPEESVRIHSASGYDGHLFALSTAGVAYNWDSENAVKFKLHKDLT